MKFMIAHISKPGPTTNNSHQNYIIEKQTTNTDNIKWDDNKENTLIAGDWLMFYCWGTRVEIHKIISITTDHTKRHSHWDINNCNILHLSRCLNTYSFVDFETYAAPYRKYKMGYKKKIAYEFDGYNELQCELNRHDATNGKYEADVKPCITFSDESRKKQENIDALLKKEQSKKDRKMKARKAREAKMEAFIKSEEHEIERHKANIAILRTNMGK